MTASHAADAATDSDATSEAAPVTDTAAAQALAAAYGQPAVPGEHGRLFGRDIVAFHRFEDLLDDATHKQKAWALLKKLPRLDQN